MADYIYAMETRLSPEQQRGVSLVQDIARAHEMNVYLTGGSIRDLVSGLPIRDLDFTVQGNALKLQKDLEKAGAVIQGTDDDLRILYLLLPGNVRAEIGMARSETYEKAGKGPAIAPATINEDLRRRDFTINAMALSLNPGSRGLLLDPSNGMADIEAKLIRILHNYAFFEDPSRLIRATRLSARFHWPLEERTQQRYDAAKENNYIEYISSRGIGAEIEQLAHEEDPLNTLKTLEKEGWLKILHPHWGTAKVDTSGLTQLMKVRQQMAELGYSVDTSAAVMYFITRRLGDKDVADVRKLLPRRDLVDSWKRLENDAHDLAKKLTGKESATPSRTWHVLSEARPEIILFLQITTKQQGVSQKIDNFFGKWRQLRQKLPLPEMAELRIVPSLPEYPKIAEEAFMLLLDGKLRSRTETLKFLKPYEPPPPPPPPAPPARRGRGARTAEVPKVQATAEQALKKRKGKAAEAALAVGVGVVQPGSALAKPEPAPTAKRAAAPDKIRTAAAAKAGSKKISKPAPKAAKHAKKVAAKKPEKKAPAKKLQKKATKKKR